MDEALKRQLSPLRDRIDAIDQQILTLLCERARTAQAVGDVKHAANAEGPVLRPEREAEVIRNLQANNAGPFPNEAIGPVWTEIISACRGLEQRADHHGGRGKRGNHYGVACARRSD